MSTLLYGFSLGLVLFLLLMPLALYGWPPRAMLSAERHTAWAAARRRLMLATAAALSMFAIWWNLHPESAQYAWVLCFPLWQHFGIRVHALAHPELDARPDNQARSATLRPRALEPELAARLARYRYAAWLFGCCYWPPACSALRCVTVWPTPGY